MSVNLSNAVLKSLKVKSTLCTIQSNTNINNKNVNIDKLVQIKQVKNPSLLQQAKNIQALQIQSQQIANLLEFKHQSNGSVLRLL